VTAWDDKDTFAQAWEDDLRHGDFVPATFHEESLQPWERDYYIRHSAPEPLAWQPPTKVTKTYKEWVGESSRICSRCGTEIRIFRVRFVVFHYGRELPDARKPILGLLRSSPVLFPRWLRRG
jgi:hypothetical protein